ncbi:hypothetical protein QYF36_005644 [Acer negundo]|nr:hypothetical protein QYF36_005644 [Acer negundo]
MGVSRSLRIDVPSPKWMPHVDGLWKINIDAAFRCSDRVVGLGIIVRNGLDRSCLAAAHKWNASFSPLVAEALAVKLIRLSLLSRTVVGWIAALPTWRG